jgi:hypothetical protein
MDFEDDDLQYPTVTHGLFQFITSMSDDERRTLLKLLENGLLEGRCRREFFRKSLRIPVTYAIGERAYHNYVKNISLGGVFIFTHSAFHAGHRIIMSFGDKDNTSPVKMVGKVARASSEGIGVEFLSPDIDKVTEILSLASEG